MLEAYNRRWHYSCNYDVQVPLDMGAVNIYDIYADTCIPSYAAGVVSRLAAVTAGSAVGVAAGADFNGSL